MHWSPEHAQSLNQWPEQHLDVSSTTSSPAHKSDLYPSTRQRFNYAWANDDISALTASNLLKRYAEKYSGVLDAPYERPALSGYGDGAFGPVNGQKGDGEPWPVAHGSDGAYPLTPIHDGLPGAKGVVPPDGPPPGYGTIHPPHPSASYLPSGIAAPTPIPAPPPAARPPGVPGYGSQGAGLAPLAVPPLGTEAAGALKRKAFDISGGEDEGEGRYRKYSYEQPKSPYPMSDNGECRGNGFGGSTESPQVAFKPGKRPAGAGNAEEHAGKYGGGPAEGKGPDPPPPRRLPPKAPVFGSPPVEEQPKNVDPLVLELVNTKIVERGPPVQWTDIAGQVSVKAAIEEELVWPILRPGAYTGASRPPRTILLFGPRGTGKSLLSRCISTQLGSTLLKLSGTTLLSTWKAEAEKILQTVFFVASCRQPAVVLITEAESLLVARAGEDGSQVSNLKSQLLSYLDNVATSSEQNVVIIGTTSRPGSMDEASHRRFAKRFYISPPDSIARRQILHHALAQQSSCLSEREMASLVQHTENFSGSELVQLCQHAGATTLHGLPGQIQPTSYQDFEKAFCKVRPAASQKELDLFLEWDKMYGTRH
ncbi:PREDICTED: putative fidgetin-like protein 2 [Nipponia nippon]|uniref:putative fidgetin-like protein 2 n=1 Tax=Nipponia nippon TaxID=128390 RepID=UPI00051142C0|nr:PREDICTED: putative fidgetin-like protein 2 [Nipponia nippon]